MEPTAAALVGHIPVFPLQGAVLFPGVVLPLHIFEPRYRDMVADAMAAHRCLVVTMMQPGHECLSAPPLCDVGCLGRIIHADHLPNGRYDILVQGLERVELLEELPSARAYRCFRAATVARPDARDYLTAHQELARLQSCVLHLGAAAASSDQQLVEVLRSTADPLDLADILAAVLVSDPQRQQSLLACNDLRQRLTDLMDHMAEHMARYTTPSPAVKSN